MLCYFKTSFINRLHFKNYFNLLKLSLLSQTFQILNFIYLSKFYLILTCSSILKLSFYAYSISKLIFSFLKLSQLSHILSLNNLPNFYLILTYSAVSKQVSSEDYCSKNVLTISTFANFFNFLKLSQILTWLFCLIFTFLNCGNTVYWNPFYTHTHPHAAFDFFLRTSRNTYKRLRWGSNW